MKKKFFVIIILILTTFSIISCSESSKLDGEQDNKIISAKNEPEDQIELLIKNMTITEKIGQMIMIGFYGYEINDDILYLLNRYHYGSIILFSRNIESESQLKQLTADLQKHSHEKLPLFIAIDEEGGKVSRLRQIEDEVAPSQEEIGNTGDPTFAKDWAIKTSSKLKFLGININFAPVADIGSPDMRSFSNDTDTVVNFVDNASRGYEDENFLYCLKHFPGIGKRVTDPHQEISSINVSRETLDKEDLLPFKSIIDNHPSDKFMIMVSHLKYPAIDADNSATLSYEVMTKLLREELGFEGIIITDDLEMGAISNHNTFSDVGVKAIKAGADVLLICHDYQHEQEVYLGVLEAIQNGELAEERINESIRRILKVKLNNLSKNR